MPQKEEPPKDMLHRIGMFWFFVAILGQGIFIVYILGYFGIRTIMGNYAGWNDGDLITGHVPGDTFGNVMFGVHVLLAAIITFGGIFQLIPFFRNRYPAIHRWNGRLFILLAYIMAVGGLWMTWGRGAHLAIISGISTSLNGVLILVFASLTLRYAIAREIDVHKKWAMRTFMVVNGVWFFRVGLMGWILINQGPLGMDGNLGGPADIAISFSSYLLPLAGLEVYRRAQNSPSKIAKVAASALVLVLTGLMAVGIVGATMFMWLPAFG